MTTDAVAPRPAPPTRRVLVTWAVLTVIAVPLVVLVLGPHLPPGNLSQEARDQRHVNTVLAALAAPVMLGIWVFLAAAIISFRERGAVLEDGPPLRGDKTTQVAWVVATAVIVIALAGWGTYELLGPAKGAGGGQGPDPLAAPAKASSALQVQVIGQQWAWTFRYPGYGGVETPELAIPAGRLVELHVTSLDVNHSFWAYQLGVKADAIQGTDNVAFVTARHPGTFEIRCAELCGLWHGHMRNTGVVMTGPAFAGWIRAQQARYAPATRVLPPYSTHYFPDPLRRAG
ncbi:MAG: cytochrome c oxidase subunit II [Solirubrobacteraceae bacterium]